jgi:hypothetical protein
MVTGVTLDCITTEGHDAYSQAIQNVFRNRVMYRTNRYLHNHLEQDHRSVKRVVGPMLRFNAFEAAQSTLARIEPMHMIRKQRLADGIEQGPIAAQQFYSLAPESSVHRLSCTSSQNLRQSLAVWCLPPYVFPQK